MRFARAVVVVVDVVARRPDVVDLECLCYDITFFQSIPESCTLMLKLIFQKIAIMKTCPATIPYEIINLIGQREYEIICVMDSLYDIQDRLRLK